MSESARVQRWRDAKRQKGLKSCTLWLTADEESLLKDLAAKRRCSPTEIMQQALAYFHTGKPPVTATVTDIEQLREMIQAEIATLQTASVLATATATVTDTEQLRTLIQNELAASPLVTATPKAPLRRGGLKLTPRQGKALRAKRARGVPVKALMEEYGVSKATVFRYLAEG